jgi:hypothetical protein
MKCESCASGHVLEGQGKPTETVRMAAGCANHMIMRCSFIPVEICLEQLHISFNICPEQKIMKNFTVLTHFSQRGLKFRHVIINNN